MNFEESIILENAKVKLEPLSMDHLSALLHISENHPNLLRYSPSPFGGEDGLRKYIQQATIDRSAGHRYSFAIFDIKTDKYVGSTSYGNISMKNLRLEIGWTWIDKSVQGTGLNKNCKYLLLSYGFNSLGLERIELKTDIRNLQSRKAIEKIGGVYEGTLRSHTLMLDGHRRDTVYYSILKSEWERLQKEVFNEM